MSQSLLSRILRSTSSAVVGAACLATLLATTNPAHAQGLYQQPSLNTNVGATAAGVASADFARSGFRSLAIVTNNNGSNNHGSLKVYLGASQTPTFGTATTYNTCKQPTAVIAQDLNGDGYPDIAVACPSAATVDIFFNDGATNPGTFEGADAYTATDPVAMVAGSFRGNGQIDLAVAGGNGGITFFKNNKGNFTTSTVAAAGTLSGIAAGDFNHDGILDLAVSDSASNNVHVLTGTGTGTFGAEVNYSAGAHTTGIQTADFNQDGYLDLAVTTSGNNVSILNGSATAGFLLYSTQAAGTKPIALSITDVNSDGYVDVIAYDSQTASSTRVGAVAVLLGNGNGILQAAQISTLSAVPGAFAAVDDFNRDGKPDLAIVQSSNVVSLLLNNTLPTAYPDGRSFAGYSPVAAGNGNMADGIATGDFNRDGQLDVAVSYLMDKVVGEPGVVRVLRNNGGAFTLSGTYPVGKQPYSVTSGDLNGDGYPDLVTANTADGTISVLLNTGKTGNGTFAPAVAYTVGKQPYQVAIGDLNGDGYPDLAVTNYGANSVSILYGSKAGTFTAGPTLTTGANPYGVVIADLQHNGYPDVAVTCFGTDMLYVYPNTAGVVANTPFMTATGSGPMSLVTGDFNRDGKLDVVVANATGGPAGDTNPITSGNNISFFAGTGNKATPFLAGVIGPSLNFPDSIAAGDVNGDGILDIVGVAPNFNAVEVTLGTGDNALYPFGTTQQRAAGEFPAKSQPWALALGDFNNDGQLDIITANTYNAVNIANPANQYRYMAQYPPVANGVPSVDLLSNASAATIGLTIFPDTFPLPAKNGGVTLTATVSGTGPTPTGSVGFEDATGYPLGASPYTLLDGSATYSTGQLGSGQHLYTTLYSGDANFQPTTSSGAAFAVTVTGTPVTLTLSSYSVVYGNTDTATVTVNGAPNGGTVTIYGAGASNNFQLTPITLNGGTGNKTFTVDLPDFTIAAGKASATYQLYALYSLANGTVAGSSSDVELQVTPDPTSITNYCLDIIFINGCYATVTPTYGPAFTPSDINFAVTPGTAGNEPINAAGTAYFPYTFPPATPPATTIDYSVVATYIPPTVPPNGNYLASSATATVSCTTYDLLGFKFTICTGGGSGNTAPASLPLNSFTGFGPGKSALSRAARTSQTQTFLPFHMF